MKVVISDILVQKVEKNISVLLHYKFKCIEFNLRTVDGKVVGNYANNFSTSYLTYFHTTTEKTRKTHFNFIKKEIEKIIS